MSEKGRGRPMKVGEALASYLERTGLDERLDEAGAVPEWDGCVGERIAAVTEPITVSGGVLIVAVRSSAWLMELKLMEREILGRLNRGRRKGRIDRIRFIMSGAGRGPAGDGAVPPAGGAAPSSPPDEGPAGGTGGRGWGRNNG